jgi:CheY-like chemotaxis protein
MEARGHRISEARDGAEGIVAAGAAVPDLILLDIQLPRMDGYAVAAALRENPALDAVPIVAVTSFAMSGDRSKALRLAAMPTLKNRSIRIALPLRWRSRRSLAAESRMNAHDSCTDRR